MDRLRRWGRLSLVFAVLMGVFAPSGQAYADNTSVTIGVGDTTVLMTGTTSPHALVTFLEGGVVIGSTTADAAGEYSKMLINQAAGIHTYQIGAQDTASRFTDTISTTANVQEHAQTTISAFLPPTVELSESQVAPGETLLASGATVPGASVVIDIDNTTSATVTANSEGEWEYALPTGSIQSGIHELYVVASKNGIGQSHQTEARHFTVLSTEQPPVAPPENPPATSEPETPPKKPASPVITSPKPGAVVDKDKITVTGTGEPGTQIELWNRGQIVGSAFVGKDGTWQLVITLKEFGNELKARACLANVCSDFSQDIQFFYQAPARGEGPEIKLDRYRWYTSTDSPVSLTAAVRGGDTPYALMVEWGDGTSDTYHTSGPRVILEHSYHKAGQYNGKATLTDEQGRKAIAQFSVGVEAKTKEGPLAWWHVAWVASALIIFAAPIWVVHSWLPSNNGHGFKKRLKK